MFNVYILKAYMSSKGNPDMTIAWILRQDLRNYTSIGL